MKQYATQANIGRARYTLSCHDGVKTHKDGSAFWDIEIFSSKIKLAARIKQRTAEGYTER